MSLSNWTPLWSTLLASSVWGEAKEVRILWITMLAAKDADGNVTASVPGLARLAVLSIDEVRGALKVLESPDPYTPDAEFEGRRIERLDNGAGWKILNHEKYQKKMQEECERRRWRESKRRCREGGGLPSNTPLPGETAYVRASENGDRTQDPGANAERDVAARKAERRGLKSTHRP